jgi:hypothetical protein
MGAGVIAARAPFCYHHCCIHYIFYCIYRVWWLNHVSCPRRRSKLWCDSLIGCFVCTCVDLILRCSITCAMIFNALVVASTTLTIIVSLYTHWIYIPLALAILPAILIFVASRLVTAAPWYVYISCVSDVICVVLVLVSLHSSIQSNTAHKLHHTMLNRLRVERGRVEDGFKEPLIGRANEWYAGATRDPKTDYGLDYTYVLFYLLYHFNFAPRIHPI